MSSLTVLLVVCVKLFLPAPIKNTELRNEFWLRKTFASPDYDLVVGGDSRIYRGVSTTAINSELSPKLQAINLGYSSAGYDLEYLNFLVSRLNPAGKRILVLGITPHSFTLEGAKNDLYHEHLDKGTFEVFKALYLSKYLKHFAPYKATELKVYVLNGTSEEGYFEDFQADGWAHSHRLPEDSLTAIEIYQKLFTDYQVSDTLIFNFFNRISEIENSGIEVIAFRPPTFELMTNVEDSLSGYNEAFMRNEMELRGCTWIDLNPAEFHTYDGSHLHYKSAEHLSKRIGQEVEKLLADKP
ncbi:MAG: hypothetical protein GQ574_16110 [Crocinitomix sp.]|nr:hypothetical protein [Crocinitomix sp.]